MTRPESPFSPLDRRKFLKAAAGLGLGTAVLGKASGLRAQSVAEPGNSAADAVGVAILGLGIKGRGHLGDLLAMPGVRVTGLCDPDEGRIARALGIMREAGVGYAPATATDARRLLERSDVDAVILTSPDNWHAVHGVWACEAGKDVYVEKPVSNDVWTGRRLVEAAKKHGRVVQAGTQARSDTGVQAAVEYVRSGQLGKVLWSHALWYRERKPIGRRDPWYPEGLDYDLFCGPAPMVPLVRDEVHYDWHWFWAHGHGEMTNLGAHCVDMARWFGGITGPARRVMSVGGRYALDDSGETPNTQIGVFDHGEDGPSFIMECRGLTAQPGATHVDNLRGIRSGVVVQCEGGYFAGHYGGAVYDNAGKRIKPFPGDGGKQHLPNFLEAVRARRPDMLAAPVELGHASCAPCLMAGISYRVGGYASPEQARAALSGFAFAEEAFDGMVRHLGKHAVDLVREPLRLGPWLEIDRSGDGIASVAGSSLADRTLERARFLLRDPQRPPHRVSEA
jgi:predicted dehydrogenase